MNAEHCNFEDKVRIVRADAIVGGHNNLMTVITGIGYISMVALDN